MKRNENLYKALKDNNIKVVDICNALGISRTAFWRKGHYINDFTATEIKIISKLCNLTSADRDAIFFD